MMAGTQAFARWEINNAKTILADRRRIIILILMLLPILLGGIAFSDDIGGALPELGLTPNFAIECVSQFFHDR